MKQNVKMQTGFRWLAQYRLLYERGTESSGTMKDQGFL